MESKAWPHVLARFLPVHPKRGFRALSAEPSRGVSVVGEASHTPELSHVHFNLPRHTYIHVLGHHPGFRGVSTLRRGISVETLSTFDRKSTVPSTPHKGVGSG